MSDATKDPIDDPKAKAAAKALVTATERLWEAITEGSPETGQTLLQTLDLAGCTFSSTVRRLDRTRFMVDVGVVDAETARGLNVYSLELVRTDASPLPILRQIAAGK
jgi:hypothetical protein